MSKFGRLPVDGEHVYVNAELVRYLAPHNATQTRIVFGDSNVLIVDVGIDDATNVLRGAK